MTCACTSCGPGGSCPGSHSRASHILPDHLTKTPQTASRVMLSTAAARSISEATRWGVAGVSRKQALKLSCSASCLVPAPSGLLPGYLLDRM